MALDLKDTSFIWGCSKPPPPPPPPPPPQLGLIGNLRYDFLKCRKWECCCLAQKATTAVEEEKPGVPLVHSPGAAHADALLHNDSKGFHKDMNLLPNNKGSQEPKIEEKPLQPKHKI